MSESMEQISARSREEILQKVAKGYKDATFKFEDSVNPVGHILTDDADCLGEMKRKMAENKYEVEEYDGGEAGLAEKINEIVARYDGFSSFIYGKGLDANLVEAVKAEKKTCFDKEIEALRETVFHTDFSVVKARFGISSHGTAMILSSPEQPRMLSLAPMLLIVLLKKEDVVKSMVEALNAVKKESDGKLPSNMLFVAGPSRTADIELVTVFGVHGSQKAHIIVY